jgi:hypothetical protein
MLALIEFSINMGPEVRTWLVGPNETSPNIEALRKASTAWIAGDVLWTIFCTEASTVYKLLA